MFSKAGSYRNPFILCALFGFFVRAGLARADCKNYVPPPMAPLVCDNFVVTALDGNNKDHSDTGYYVHFTNSNGFKPYNRDGTQGQCQNSHYGLGTLGVRGKHVLLEIAPMGATPGPDDPSADRAKIRVEMGPNYQFEDGSRTVTVDMPRAGSFKKYLDVLPNADCNAALEAWKRWNSNPVASQPPTATLKNPPLNTAACQIVSTTEATVPTDRSRKRIGIGEVVFLSVQGSSSWSLTGPGKLAYGATTRFIAPDRAGNSTVTATVVAGSCSTTFSVIEPSGMKMVRYPGSNLCHHEGVPDIGFAAKRYLTPADVSFRNLSFRERLANTGATGVFEQTAGTPHDTSPITLRVLDVVEGVGAEVQGADVIYSGRPFALDNKGNIKTDASGRYLWASPPYQPGWESIQIPGEFSVGSSTDFKPLPALEQRIELLGDRETLIASKGGVRVSVRVSSPTTLFNLPGSRVCSQ